MQLCARLITDTVKFTRKVFSDRFCTHGADIKSMQSLKEDPVFGFKPGGENPPDRSSAIKPRSRSHDQPNPKAFLLVRQQLPTCTVSPPFFTPPALSTDAGTILQCVFGPRCGRAAPSVSKPWPPNNALTGEVQQGSTIIDGFSKNSASGSTPPQSSDLWPPINIPAIWQTQRDRRVGPPFSIQQCGVCSN